MSRSLLVDEGRLDVLHPFRKLAMHLVDAHLGSDNLISYHLPLVQVESQSAHHITPKRSFGVAASEATCFQINSIPLM